VELCVQRVRVSVLLLRRMYVTHTWRERERKRVCVWVYSQRGLVPFCSRRMYITRTGREKEGGRERDRESAREREREREREKGRERERIECGLVSFCSDDCY